MTTEKVARTAETRDAKNNATTVEIEREEYIRELRRLEHNAVERLVADVERALEGAGASSGDLATLAARVSQLERSIQSIFSRPKA